MGEGVVLSRYLEGELPGYNFWLRSVAAEPQEIYRSRPWLFWQFTTTGYVPGIEKPVDRNVFNGSAGDWRQVQESGEDRRPSRRLGGGEPARHVPR